MKKLFTIDIPESRNFGLDLLRFFAIVFVLINHGSYQLSLPLKKINPYLYLDGVLLFFVLSGFLIGTIFIKLFEKKQLKKNILNFWIRRWLRTIPAYFFVLTIVCILHFNIYNELDFFKTLNHFLFVQNFTEFDSYLFPEAWSLSIEEWFYLLLPILTLVSFIFIKNKEKAFFLVIIFFILVCPALRFLQFQTHSIPNDISKWDEHFRSVTILRLDSIMFGVAAAYLNFYHEKIFFSSKKTKFIIGILMLVLLRAFDFILGYDSLIQTVFSFTLNSVAVFLMLPFLYKMKLPKSKIIVMIVTFTSLISYSLYLVNSTLLQALFLNNIGFEKPFYIKYFAYWILSFLAATLIYKFVELPFMKIRDKHFK